MNVLEEISEKLAFEIHETYVIGNLTEDFISKWMDISHGRYEEFVENKNQKFTTPLGDVIVWNDAESLKDGTVLFTINGKRPKRQ